MIEVSDAWKDVQQRFLLPETFIEIDFNMDVARTRDAVTGINSTNQANYSNIQNVIEGISVTKYATNELNLWALDGSCSIVPDVLEYAISGYVSDIASSGDITFSFDKVQETATSGLTITWSRNYGEYPVVFTATTKKGTATVEEVTITDNASPDSIVPIKLEDYDSVNITVHNWSMPDRRARIESVMFGQVFTLNKSNLLSYSHEQYGDILSGELPKSSIEFSIDNRDGSWDLTNPISKASYLVERQKISVKYGLDINGTVEWIKGGTFYLSEWDIPANGMEARFVARDSLDFMLNDNAQFGRSGTFLITNMATMVESLIPEIVPYTATPELANVPFFRTINYSGSLAERLQKAANAGQCVIRYDRDGVLNIERLNTALTEYRIPKSLSYSHPELTLTKAFKTIRIDHGADEPYELNDNTVRKGEVQTVSNDYITTDGVAADVAEWINGVVKNRKIISGEYRADPRLDLFDVVTVESKYGVFTPVVITEIKYAFDGAFRGSFKGRVLEDM